MQEVHDLRQLLLFLVCTGYVLERDGLGGRNAEAGVGLREVCHAVGPAVCAAREEEKEDKQHNTADDIRRCRAVPRVARGQIVIALERPGCVLLGDQIVEVCAELLGIADFCRGGGGSVAASSHLHGEIASL